MLVVFGTLCNSSGGDPFFLEGSFTDYYGHYFSEGGGYIVFNVCVRL